MDRRFKYSPIPFCCRKTSHQAPDVYGNLQPSSSRRTGRTHGVATAAVRLRASTTQSWPGAKLVQAERHRGEFSREQGPWPGAGPRSFQTWGLWKSGAMSRVPLPLRFSRAWSRTVTTDKWRAYIKPIKEILPDARHMQSEGMRADINNNLSERLQGTIRERLKTMRGLDRIASGRRYLDGWVIHYNLFRKHHSLRNQTPGSRAKLEVPFKEWTDVVKADAVEPQLVSATPRRNEKADALAVELTGTPTPSKPRKSSRASGSEQAPPRIVRTPKPKTVKREPARRKGRSAKQHPYYKLRERARRATRGGR